MTVAPPTHSVFGAILSQRIGGYIVPITIETLFPADHEMLGTDAV